MPNLKGVESILSKSIDTIVWLDFDMDFDSIISNLLIFGIGLLLFLGLWEIHNNPSGLSKTGDVLSVNTKVMPVKLHSIRFENPGAPVMIILHGLLGASRNWVTIGKTLQNRFDIHALDLRNHGNSPHADTMRWSELIADLKLYLESNSLSDIILMGHSLGGKVAMKFACSYPKWVKKLIVVDIAAKSYPPYLDVEFRAMKRIPAGSLENRREAEELLKPLIPDWGMRQFLMMNLVRDEFGLKWQVNLEVLHASLQILRQNSLDTKDIFKGASLLIAGGKSDFIESEDVDAMRKWFPNLEYHMLPKAGHNVHVDDREGFLDILGKWVT